MAGASDDKRLDSAQLQAEDIGYINAHGTATPLNDSMESKAIHRILQQGSRQFHQALTKYLEPQVIEAAIAWHIFKIWLTASFTKMSMWIKAEDIEIDLQTVQKLKVKNILSNSFAFGGK